MKQLASNLKYLRKNSGLTQQQLADRIGIKRAALGTYEEGRAEPKLDTLAVFCKFFNISFDNLINAPLNNNWSDGLDTTGSRLRVLPITVNSQNEELLTLVPQTAVAGYLKGYADFEYIENLPQFSLPFTELKKQFTHRIFQIEGDSMLPLNSGTYLIARFVQDWTQLKNGSCYIFLTEQDGLVYKRLHNFNKTNQSWELASDNPIYKNYDLALSNTLEVWQAVAYTSFEMPSQAMAYNNIQQVSEALYQLQEEVFKLRKELNKT